MKTKTSLLLFCFMMLFALITYAQCPAGLLNYETIESGKKVIITEIPKSDETYETYKSWIGKVVEVYSDIFVEEGCWYNGELMYGDDENFFVNVRVKAAPGETYGNIAAAAVKEETKAASDFPVGTRVKVHGIPVTDKNSYSFYSEAPTVDYGEVVEADLKKNANGTYSGCILTGEGLDIRYRTKKCFTENKVEKRL